MNSSSYSVLNSAQNLRDDLFTKAFVPGVYTVALDDQWGQAVFLYFEVA